MRIPGLVSAAILALASSAQAYDAIQFLKPLKIDDMSKPIALAASETRMYILDGKKDSLYIYSMDGALIKAVGRSGSEKTGFSGPSEVTVGFDGRIYVADTDNSRIQILDADGEFLGSFGRKGSSTGELKYPQGVAQGADTRIYVADTGNDRIQVYTRDGVYLFSFGGGGKDPGRFRKPTRVMVDAADFVYVLDSGNERIQKFDSKTKFVKEFNLLGKDFTMDSYGFFYIADPKAGKVREQSPEGQMLGTFGSKGSGHGQFKDPTRIAQAPDGTLLILDPDNARIQRVELVNKLKKDKIAQNLQTKLLVAGPTQVWPVEASAVAAKGGETIYAYLPKEGRFAAFDAAGKVQFNFGTRSKKDGEEKVTWGSRGMAFSEKHGLYVSDSDGDKMQQFDAQGAYVSAFAGSSSFFDSKKKEGRVKDPQGVAINEQGMVYVADVGNRRVDAFSHDGTFLFAIGPKLGSDQLQEPVGVAWDPAGFVYILDRGLKKVFKCEPSGGFKQAWGGGGSDIGQFMEPVAIAYDGNNYVYVLDKKARRVSVFTKDGSWVTNFFAGGDDERSLEEPVGLMAYEQNLLITDPGKKRILFFGLRPRIEPPSGVSATVAEGIVELKWKPGSDNWIASYQILRSTSAAGPYVEIGSTPNTDFRDSKVSAYSTYFYRVATVAKTKDVGPGSVPSEVYVPGASNRPPLEISEIDMGNIFSANYKYYEKNNIGKLTLINNVNLPFQNVKVTFRLKDFMDFGTDKVLPIVEAQQTVEIPLKAVLNNRILDVTEDTPIQAEFTLTYFEAGKPQTVSITKPLRVYSRNAITWDKPERIATFITSNDTPIKDFKSKVINESKAASPAAEALDESLTTAMRLWHALGEAGVRFQPAPNNPFEEMSEDPSFPVDYTQFPRETLKRKSGECDDLVNLLSSLFESAGIRTAILDYPGHLALMIDTRSNDAVEIGLPESQLIKYDNTYWIPIEATMVGSPFLEAHRHAVNAHKEMEKKGKANIIDPRKAWAAFEPATMPATDWSLDAPKADEVAKKFEADAKEYAQSRYSYLKKHLQGELAKNGKDTEALNQLGILEVEMGQPEKAGEEFGKALSVDPANAAAMNNLGGLAFVSGDYAKAEAWFLKAAEKDATDPGIWLNLAKSAAKLKQAAKAKEYGDKALALEPENNELKTAIEAVVR